MIHTENSFKYTPDSIKLMLSQAGLKIENMWCDDDKMFSLTLAFETPSCRINSCYRNFHSSLMRDGCLQDFDAHKMSNLSMMQA